MRGASAPTPISLGFHVERTIENSAKNSTEVWRTGAYHIAGSKVSRRSGEVCFEDLGASRNQGITPCSEIVPGFATVLICEADSHVAAVDNVHGSLMG